MHGFKASAKRTQPQKLANGGRVSGPGTGTSDSIKAEVPEGSYIMPADSTAQLGEQALAGMGGSVPVNLSDGEYQLPPEQVHAVGVQALNQVKDATHAPVGQQADGGLGFKPNSAKTEGDEPELFFANGGAVNDDEYKRALARQVQNTISPGTGYLNADMGAGALKAAAGTVAAPFAALIDAGYDARNSLLDADPAKSAGGNGKFFSAAADTAKQGIEQVGQGFKTSRTDMRNDLGLDAAKPSAPAASPVQAPPVQATPASAAPVSPAQQPIQQSVQTPASSEIAPAGFTSQAGNNVTRVGNSYSGSNITEGFTINGQPQSRGGYMVTPGDKPAAAAPQPAAAGFTPGGGPSVTVIGDSSRADSDRQKLMNAASTPYGGSPNGQLTANQLNVMRNTLDGENRDSTARYVNDQNNSGQLAQAQLRESGANERAAIQESGANSRAAANNSIEQQKVAGDLEARGFQSRALARQEKLYAKYEAAAPEERTAIAQQIRELSGREAPNKFTVVPGGQEIVDGVSVTRPSMVLDNQTGTFMQQPQQGGGQRPPQVGEQRGAYKFKGGNPADQKNWEKI